MRWKQMILIRVFVEKSRLIPLDNKGENKIEQHLLGGKTKA